MSWVAGLEGTIEDIVALKPSEHIAAHEAHKDQFDVTRDLAVVLIESGVVGDPDKFRFRVSLSGHGNPNHEPDPAWANDCVAINISQTEAIDAGTED